MLKLFSSVFALNEQRRKDTTFIGGQNISTVFYGMIYCFLRFGFPNAGSGRCNDCGR
jgi:hypothetical protein